jgi:pimeloyl-ACP methyl ester carboxylesterase
VPQRPGRFRLAGRGGLLALAVLLILPSPVAAGGPAPATRHLIYLHGRIVQEQQDARPRHPRFGYYELQAILAAFRDRGFVVTGEIRPKTASVGESADQVVIRVRRLLDAGVPGERVTVVGASMGAGIALVASTRLRRTDVRFAVLGACLSRNVDAIAKAEGGRPVGHVLSIREASDDATEPCPAWSQPDSSSSLEVREILLHTGLAHGFLYRPLPEWVGPVAKWALARPVP